MSFGVCNWLIIPGNKSLHSDKLDLCNDDLLLHDIVLLVVVEHNYVSILKNAQLQSPYPPSPFYISIYLSLYPIIYLYLSIYLSKNLSIYLSKNLSILSIYLLSSAIYLFIYYFFFLCLYICIYFLSFNIEQ